ncbi:MAG: ABC transporter permease [Terracidiphilus sp.]|nr:ABC transporter permease [Terracidiphilus sp.]
MIGGRLLRKLKLLVGRGRYERELAEEMENHRKAIEAELCDDGVTAEEARYAAARRFGNVARSRDESHGAISFGAETVAQDVRFAVRQLVRDPGLAVTATAILALGIAASVAIFAFVDAALIRPLPYVEPNRLMDVTESLALFPRGNLSYPDYVDWKRMNKSFRSLAVYQGGSALLQTSQGGEPVRLLRVSAEFFSTLGVAPAEGRDFRIGEDAADAQPTALLSYATWQSRYGGRRDVIGQTVKLSGVATTIIGVARADFEFVPRNTAEYFVALQPNGECLKRRSCHGLMGIGRLRDGVTETAAREEMKAIAAQLERQYPDSNRGQGASVMPLAQAFMGDLRTVLLALLGGAALLLLIACLNVANLLLVRAEKRRREMAVRGALGASRVRLARQCVTESTVLTVAGAVLGLVLAQAAMRVLRGLISNDMQAQMPFLQAMGLTGHVLGFAATVSVVAVAVFSLAPVLRLPGELRDGMGEGGRTAAGRVWKRLGANMVVVELAVAVVLLASAGLLTKSLWKMLHVDLGFDPEHLATLQVGLSDTAFNTDTKQAAFAERAMERVRALPGVEQAAVTTLLPVTCNCNTDWVRFVGKPYNGVHNEVNDREVSSGYFRTLGARLQRGRMLTEDDDVRHPKVVMINEAFAQKYFPGEDPVGKMIGGIALSPDSLRQIVGVVANIKDGALDTEEWPTEYQPFAQGPGTYFALAVRTRGDAAAMLPALSAAVRGLSPEVGVDGEATMTGAIRDSYSAWLHRSAAWLVGGFAGLAFLLSMIGLYGTVAYSVSQRTREIGVRMALGAQRTHVSRMILREASRLSVVGVALGLAGAVGAAQLLRGLLFGVRAWDAATLVGVAVALLLAALGASALPAARAAQMNPMDALRME